MREQEPSNVLWLRVMSIVTGEQILKIQCMKSDPDWSYRENKQQVLTDGNLISNKNVGTPFVGDFFISTLVLT